MNKKWRLRLWQILWRGAACTSLMLPTSVRALQAISPTTTADGPARLTRDPSTGGLNLENFKLWSPDKFPFTLPRGLDGRVTIPLSAPLSAPIPKPSSALDCAVDPIQVPGQPYLIDTSIEVLGDGLPSTVPTLANIFSVSSAVQPTEAAVDILVVDHFAFAPIPIRSSSPSQTILLSHGSLVVAHIRTLLEKAEYSLKGTGYSAKGDKPLIYANGGRIINIYTDEAKSANQNASTTAEGRTVNSNTRFFNWSEIREMARRAAQGGSPVFHSTGTSPISMLDLGTTYPSTPIPTSNLPQTLSDSFPNVSSSFPSTLLPPPTSLISVQQSLSNYFIRPINLKPVSPTNPNYISVNPLPGSPGYNPNNQNNQRSLNVIVNMSLSIMNCALLSDYYAYRAYNGINTTLKSYAKAQLGINKISEGEILRAINSVPSDSDFMNFLREIIASNDVPNSHAIAVAASGNYGLDYPTAPGSLSNVISVGARQWDWKEPSPPWSNTADVVTIGTNFTILKDDLQRFCRDGGTCITDDIKLAVENGQDIPKIYTNLSYSGTSFAAPSVTAFLATRVGDTPCFNNAGEQRFKPLQGQVKHQKLVFTGDWIQQTCKTKIVEPLRLPYSQ